MKMKNIIPLVFGILFLLIIPLTAKSLEAKDETQTVLKNLDEFEKSLADWMQNFDTLGAKFEALEKNVNKSLAPVLDATKDIKGMEERLTSIISRLTTVERGASITEITATITSFNETLSVIKKLLSDLTKRVEDQEVKTAVLEKRYQEAQRPLEPIKKAIDDLNKSVTEKLGEQEKKIASFDERFRTQIQSFEVQTKTLGDLQKQVRKLETTGTAIAGTTTVPVAQAPAGGTETAKLAEAGTETAKVVKGPEVIEEVKERAPTPEEEGFQEIGEGFYIRNVSLFPFGSSSQIKGEIKNLSDMDRSIAIFGIKIYNNSDIPLFTQDFSVKTFKKGETRTFNEIISGYSPLEIAKYEITSKRRY